MDSRQQFEKWITTTGLDADLSRGNHGCYLNPPTHWLYCAWVESRKAMVIELPKIYPDCYCPSTATAYREDCLKSMEESGLKVKL